MKKLTLVFLLSFIISGCSVVTDYLLKQDTGISVDLQTGSNENKVKTGVGSLGLDKKTNLTVEDSSDIAIHNTDDKFHITTDGDTEINVYETNYWLYAIFTLFIFGKPLLRTLLKRNQRHNLYKYIDSISALSRTGLDRNKHR